MIRSAKDLSAEQKAIIESLLGRRVLDNESVSIRAIEPPPLSDDRKHEISEALKKYFAEVDGRRAQGSAQKAEEIIDDAMKSVRPGYFSHR